MVSVLLFDEVEFLEDSAKGIFVCPGATAGAVDLASVVEDSVHVADPIFWEIIFQLGFSSTEATGSLTGDGFYCVFVFDHAELFFISDWVLAEVVKPLLYEQRDAREFEFRLRWDEVFSVSRLSQAGHSKRQMIDVANGPVRAAGDLPTGEGLVFFECLYQRIVVGALNAVAVTMLDHRPQRPCDEHPCITFVHCK